MIYDLIRSVDLRWSDLRCYNHDPSLCSVVPLARFPRYDTWHPHWLQTCPTHVMEKLVKVGETPGGAKVFEELQVHGRLLSRALDYPVVPMPTPWPLLTTWLVPWWGGWQLVGIGAVLGPSWRCREANSRVRVLVENIGTRATLVKMLDKYRRWIECTNF